MNDAEEKKKLVLIIRKAQIVGYFATFFFSVSWIWCMWLFMFNFFSLLLDHLGTLSEQRIAAERETTQPIIRWMDSGSVYCSIYICLCVCVVLAKHAAVIVEFGVLMLKRISHRHNKAVENFWCEPNFLPFVFILTFGKAILLFTLPGNMTHGFDANECCCFQTFWHIALISLGTRFAKLHFYALAADICKWSPTVLQSAKTRLVSTYGRKIGIFRMIANHRQFSANIENYDGTVLPFT